MDRLSRTLTGCGLALLLAAPGCHSAPSRVPPGKRLTTDGQPGPVSFGNDPHAMNGMNSPYGAQPAGIPGQFGNQSTIGTPMTGGSPLATPAGGAFGPIGTSGALGQGYGLNNTPPASGGTSLMGGAANANPAMVDPTVTPSSGYQPGGSLPMPGGRP